MVVVVSLGDPESDVCSAFPLSGNIDAHGWEVVAAQQGLSLLLSLHVQDPGSVEKPIGGVSGQEEGGQRGGDDVEVETVAESGTGAESLFELWLELQEAVDACDEEDE